MLIFGLGTTLAYFAVNFQMLLIARMIQAMGVGISAPVFQTIMSSVYPPENGVPQWGQPELLLA